VGMKTIVVNDETHAELKSWGEFGESFEDVIKKLMKCCKEKRKNE
jgi:predicted CopG family antitoxin